MRRLLVTAPLALALALGGTACGGGRTVRRTVSAATVEGKAAFHPASVTVDKGDKVRLHVDNSTDRPHGFNVEGYGRTQRVVEPGKPADVSFTASRAGTFRIFCHLHPTHQAGTLLVR